MAEGRDERGRGGREEKKWIDDYSRIIYNIISWGGNNSANSMRKAAIFWFVMLCAQNEACSSCLLRTLLYANLILFVQVILR
jgi:hypothetical protein